MFKFRSKFNSSLVYFLLLTLSLSSQVSESRESESRKSEPAFISEFQNYLRAFYAGDWKIRIENTTGNETDTKVEKFDLYTNEIEDSKVIVGYSKNRTNLYLVRRDSKSSWISNNKTRSPLRVSFAQKVSGEINLEDITGIDLSHYTFVSIDDNEALLEVKPDEKLPFYYLKLSPISEPVKDFKGISGKYTFKIIFLDRNKNSIREAFYYIGTRVSRKTPTLIKVVDLVNKDSSPSFMQNVSVSESSLSRRFFRYQNLNQLLSVVEP